MAEFIMEFEADSFELVQGCSDSRVDSHIDVADDLDPFLTNNL